MSTLKAARLTQRLDKPPEYALKTVQKFHESTFANTIRHAKEEKTSYLIKKSIIKIKIEIGIVEDYHVR